jgi:multiple sugar transport system permease protein
MSRGLVSPTEWATTRIRLVLRTLQVLLLGGLLLTGLGPVLWLAKAAITSTQDTIRTPLSVFPHGFDYANLATAWTRVEIDKHFFNTVVLAAGSWAVQLVVATTAGYALAVLRPRYGGFVIGVVLATLFVPSIVLLVPLYLTVVDTGMINTFWAVWLPSGASAFNVILVQRFFASLPREMLEAARVDGAGPFRVFWSVVLPLSRPVIGVVSVFAVVASWKDFLWPLLVLPDRAVQPLSVRLPALQRYVELDVFLAALAISTIIPVAIFLLFQRLFLRGGALEGAIKG